MSSAAQALSNPPGWIVWNAPGVTGKCCADVWQKRIATLSFWALQRGNGGCPGTRGAGTCSRVKQPTWWFSHIFEPFTR